MKEGRKKDFEPACDHKLTKEKERLLVIRNWQRCGDERKNPWFRNASMFEISEQPGYCNIISFLCDCFYEWGFDSIKL